MNTFESKYKTAFMLAVGLYKRDECSHAFVEHIPEKKGHRKFVTEYKQNHFSDKRSEMGPMNFEAQSKHGQTNTLFY